MSIVYPGRYTAQLDGSFVVFIIGMRVNRLRAVHDGSRRRRFAPAGSRFQGDGKAPPGAGGRAGGAELRNAARPAPG